MHKKDKVKEVIEKYIDQGKDFFELTPSYLMSLDELKGYSERTLKRGRTEYKKEHKDALAGKSKAALNLKRKVYKYLEEQPKTKLAELKKKFSTADEKQLNEYFRAWRKENREKQGKTAKKEKATGTGADSFRQKVFSFLKKNPEATLKKLEKAFPDDNKKTLSNYLDQWRKESNGKIKKISAKKRISDYLDQHPDSTLKELKKAFPDINPSSIGAYHSLWKNDQTAEGGKTKPRAKVAKKTSDDIPAAASGSEKQVIEALNNTIEAQQKTIEVLKAQIESLKESQKFTFPDLKGMTKREIDKFERVMATFLRGLRK